MILKRNSLVAKVLIAVIPMWIPIGIVHCRVGINTSDYVQLKWL